jgi:hypothetical protein
MAAFSFEGSRQKAKKLPLRIVQKFFNFSYLPAAWRPFSAPTPCRPSASIVIIPV